MSADTLPSDSPYEAVGGRDAVCALVERFYDVMDESEPELARLHALDEAGRVARSSRERFAQFLVGWLGGPQDYVRENGHPRLRMRHAHVPVDIAQRDAWMRCMRRALADCGVPEPTRSFLDQRFLEVANFMRNVQE